MGLIPGGAYRNQEHVSGLLDAGDVEEVYVDLLSDPQTSGGDKVIIVNQGRQSEGNDLQISIGGGL